MALNLLDSLITVEQQQLTPKIAIPTRINFNFTESSLKQIDRQRKNWQRLQLSPALLAELRYYSLFHNSANSNSLVFITYYLQQQQKIAVIKTVISVRGKISQQLCRSFLTNPQLLKDLVINHYWLIEEVCDLALGEALRDRLSWQYQNKSFLLALVIALIISLIIALIFYFITVSLPIALIIFIVFFGLSYWIIKLILNKYLTSFILQQLLFGFFSKNTARRRLGMMLLRRFG